MKNFKQGNRFGGNKFGKKNFGKRDFGGQKQMHDAVCNKCGKKCQVPFRPTGEKPIYCSDCFDRERGNSGERNFDRKDQGRNRFEEKRMYQAVCSECGDKCEIPFLPTGGRAVYCKNCFDRGSHTTDSYHDALRREHRPPKQYGNHNTSESNYKEQFAELNSKLDQLIQLLTPIVKTPAVEKKSKSTTKTKSTLKKPAKKTTTTKKSKLK